MKRTIFPILVVAMLSLAWLYASMPSVNNRIGPSASVKADTLLTSGNIPITDSSGTRTFIFVVRGVVNYRLGIVTNFAGTVSDTVNFGDAVTTSAGTTLLFTITNDSLMRMWLPNNPTDSTTYWRLKAQANAWSTTVVYREHTTGTHTGTVSVMEVL